MNYDSFVVMIAVSSKEICAVVYITKSIAFSRLIMHSKEVKMCDYDKNSVFLRESHFQSLSNENKAVTIVINE